MGQDAERRGDRSELGREAHDKRVEPDEDQREHDRHREDERGDLVARDARRPDSDAGEPEDQQSRTDVLCDQDPHLGSGAQREAERDGERDGEGEP